MLELEEHDYIPEHIPAAGFVLRAINRGDSYYRERTGRNIGWITNNEQTMLRTACISIAGTGGMGGLVAQIMVRLGIGEIRIADPEWFDLSNLNRQAAAGRNTIGRSKAVETARMLRAITDDYRLVVYPQGVESNMLEQFTRSADCIIDEIEFWNIGACIGLHQEARRSGIPIFNCLTAGFATYLHLFTKDSATAEQMLGLEYEEALDLERSMLDGSISDQERQRLATAILECFLPGLPGYGADRDIPLQRLRQEGVASIIATNPPVAAGIVANHVLLYLLAAAGGKRTIASLPVTPGYVFFDAARLETKIILARKGKRS